MSAIRSLIQSPTLEEELAINQSATWEECMAVLNSYVKKIQPNQAVFHHMLAIPGAGKSTISKKLLTDRVVPDGTLRLAFDDVMEMLSGYKNMQKVNALQAQQTYEGIAKAIGYEILFLAIERRAPILFDHSAARADHAVLLQRLKQEDYGYQIHMHRILCDVETAKSRAASRTIQIPEHYFYERDKIINDLEPQYRQIADRFYVYDNR